MWSTSETVFKCVGGANYRHLSETVSNDLACRDRNITLKLCPKTEIILKSFSKIIITDKRYYC